MRAADLSTPTRVTPLKRLPRLLAVIGPGLVVMLADIEAGSVITLAQSGAQWGYRLLLLQILLIPLMFMAQELTVRLGLCTGKGYAELVRQRYGQGTAMAAAAVLLLSCFGALITEMSGLVGAGSLFGIPAWQTLTLLVALIIGMVFSGSYRMIERMAVGIGLSAAAFVVMAVKARPDAGEVAHELWRIPYGDHRYLYLVAANLGTSIMPWTIFYQQSALINKGLDSGQLRAARIETMFGAILCQILSAAVLIAAASSLSARHNKGLDSIAEIGEAFGALLGPWGKALFAIGLSGGALVATIVVCLSAGWAMGEATGVRHSLEQHPREAPWFYGPFVALLIACALLVGSGVDLIRLSIAVAVLNALLLPFVLLLLFLLAHRALPEQYRLKGIYALLVGTGLGLTAALGLYAGMIGSLG